jgi:hypothetical protein
METTKLRLYDADKQTFTEICMETYATTETMNKMQLREAVESNPPKRTSKKLLWLIPTVLFIAGGMSYFTFSSLVPKPEIRSVNQAFTRETMPEGMDSARVEQLKSMGFTIVPDVQNYNSVSKRQYYKKEFGLLFIGDNELQKFLDDNDFIMGPATSFRENVPPQAIDKIQENASRLKIKFSYDQTWAVLRIDSDGNIRGDGMYNPLYIIAGAKSFNTEGMELKEGILTAIPPKDPIALAKVDGGYVELANW